MGATEADDKLLSLFVLIDSCNVRMLFGWMEEKQMDSERRERTIRIIGRSIQGFLEIYFELLFSLARRGVHRKQHARKYQMNTSSLKGDTLLGARYQRAHTA